MKQKIYQYLLNCDFDFWDLVPEMGNMPQFVGELKKMLIDGLITINSSIISLTPKGKEEALALNLFPTSFLRVEKNIEIDNTLLKKFIRIRRKINKNINWEQLQLTCESVMRKVEIMKRRGDLVGKDILCIGDDDMLSVALALTKLPRKIAILDIDQNIVAYVNETLKKLGYEKESRVTDFLDGVPEDFRESFDIFCTEPPDTIKGEALFFSRGIECLKPHNGIAYIGLMDSDLKKEEILKIQKNVLEAKGMITDMFDQIGQYEPSPDELKFINGLPEGIEAPTHPWQFSSLIRIEFLDNPKVLVKGAVNEPFANFVKPMFDC
ncbi:MAG TPA: bis-aminopropyl spermidine synthase family protein [Candidatus Pacearchaeota archaeon]|nr:bis-aminopropyl spermidine synthase family protein [Candidatus Pacearchaeota archaeon]